MFIYNIYQNNFEFLTPFFFLTLIILTLILFYVILNFFFKHKDVIDIIYELIIILLILLIYLFYITNIYIITLCNGLIIWDEFSKTFSIILIILTVFFLLLQKPYILKKKILKFESLILILISILGMCILISSNNLILFYLAIELQSLCAYLLALSNNRSIISSNVALKYFVLGSVASAFILLGCSYIYLATGTLNFSNIFTIILNLKLGMFNISSFSITTTTVCIGLFFIYIGLFFKLGVAPFHLWVPDVYEGTPLNISLFFATIPKIALFGILIKLHFNIFSEYAYFFYYFIYLCVILCIIIGSFTGLYQSKIKKLLAFSGITHVGYTLIGFITLEPNVNNLYSIIFYLFSYIIMGLCIWGCYSCILLNNKQLKYLSDFNGLNNQNPMVAIILILNLFSLAGIPPLLGFFSKYFILKTAYTNSLYFLIIFIVIISIFSAYMYIRLKKNIFLENYSNIYNKDFRIEPGFGFYFVCVLFIFITVFFTRFSNIMGLKVIAYTLFF